MATPNKPLSATNAAAAELSAINAAAAGKSAPTGRINPVTGLNKFKSAPGGKPGQPIAALPGGPRPVPPGLPVARPVPPGLPRPVSGVGMPGLQPGEGMPFPGYPPVSGVGMPGLRPGEGMPFPGHPPGFDYPPKEGMPFLGQPGFPSLPVFGGGQPGFPPGAVFEPGLPGYPPGFGPDIPPPMSPPGYGKGQLGLRPGESMPFPGMLSPGYPPGFDYPPKEGMPFLGQPGFPSLPVFGGGQLGQPTTGYGGDVNQGSRNMGTLSQPQPAPAKYGGYKPIQGMAANLYGGFNTQSPNMGQMQPQYAQPQQQNNMFGGPGATQNQGSNQQAAHNNMFGGPGATQNQGSNQQAPQQNNMFGGPSQQDDQGQQDNQYGGFGGGGGGKGGGLF